MLLAPIYWNSHRVHLPDVCESERLPVHLNCGVQMRHGEEAHDTRHVCRRLAVRDSATADFPHLFAITCRLVWLRRGRHHAKAHLRKAPGLTRSAGSRVKRHQHEKIGRTSREQRRGRPGILGHHHLVRESLGRGELRLPVPILQGTSTTATRLVQDAYVAA